MKKVSKREYWQSSIANSMSDSKKLWKTINGIINYKNPKNIIIDCVKDHTGNRISEREEIADKLNENFISMVDNLMQNNTYSNLPSVPLNQSDRVPNSFFLSPFTVPEVVKSINSLNVNKSSRSDVPKIKFLKMSVNIISPIIVNIFNKCITHGKFPISLKLAEVVVYTSQEISKI